MFAVTALAPTVLNFLAQEGPRIVTLSGNRALLTMCSLLMSSEQSETARAQQRRVMVGAWPARLLRVQVGRGAEAGCTRSSRALTNRNGPAEHAQKQRRAVGGRAGAERTQPAGWVEVRQAERRQARALCSPPWTWRLSL